MTSHCFEQWVKIFLTYFTIMYLFEPPLSKHVHLCPLLTTANHKLKFHFEMILKKKKRKCNTYLLSTTYSPFFSLFTHGIILWAKCTLNGQSQISHLSKNSGVDKFRDTLIYQYISEIVLFDYYYTLLLYIKTFSRVIIILTTIGQVK